MWQWLITKLCLKWYTSKKWYTSWPHIDSNTVTFHYWELIWWELTSRELILWEVDLVGSWSGGSWSRGSWFHGSWSRKYESTNGHRNHSSPLLWSRHHFCYCKNFSGRKSIHWLKHPDHLKLANEWVWSRWSPRSECVKRKLWFKFPGLSLERCPCRNAVKGLVSSAFWSFFVL